MLAQDIQGRGGGGVALTEKVRKNRQTTSIILNFYNFLFSIFLPFYFSNIFPIFPNLYYFPPIFLLKFKISQHLPILTQKFKHV